MRVGRPLETSARQQHSAFISSPLYCRRPNAEKLRKQLTGKRIWMQDSTSGLVVQLAQDYTQLGVCDALSDACKSAQDYRSRREPSTAAQLCTQLASLLEILKQPAGSLEVLNSLSNSAADPIEEPESPTLDSSTAVGKSHGISVSEQTGPCVTEFIDCADNDSEFDTPGASPQSGISSAKSQELSDQLLLQSFAALEIGPQKPSFHTPTNTGAEREWSAFQRACVAFDVMETPSVGLMSKAKSKLLPEDVAQDTVLDSEAGEVSDAEDFESPASSPGGSSPEVQHLGSVKTPTTSDEPVLVQETPESSHYVTAGIALRQETESSIAVCKSLASHEWPSQPETLQSRTRVSFLADQTPKGGLGGNSTEETSPQVAQSTIRKKKNRFVIDDDTSKVDTDPPASTTREEIAKSAQDSDTQGRLCSVSNNVLSAPYYSPSLASLSSDAESDPETWQSRGEAPPTTPHTRFGSVLEEIDLEEDTDDQESELTETLPPCMPLTTREQQLPPRDKSALPTNKPMTAAAFKRARDGMAASFFTQFNRECFDGRLPHDLEIGWNVHLKTTAGLTHYKREYGPDQNTLQYSARVELSSKVVDSEYKLRNTLAHELCHVAAWILNHKAKPPHGDHFKHWAQRCSLRFPDLTEISTCHSYDIHLPFQWKCSNEDCGSVIKRHSNSINIAKKGCGSCCSPLNFLGKFNADGTPAAKRGPNQYSLFVKDNFSAMKKQLPRESTNAEVMKALASRWKEQKNLAVPTRRPLEDSNTLQPEARPTRLFS